MTKPQETLGEIIPSSALDEEARKCMPPPPPPRQSTSASDQRARRQRPPVSPRPQRQIQRAQRGYEVKLPEKELHRDGYYWSVLTERRLPPTQGIGVREVYKCEHPGCPATKEHIRKGRIIAVDHCGLAHNHDRPHDPFVDDSVEYWEIIDDDEEEDNYDEDEDEDEDDFMDVENQTDANQRFIMETSSALATSNDDVTTVELPTEDEEQEDGYNWVSTGFKKYFRCAVQGCNIKKVVERKSMEFGTLSITYIGRHDHRQSYKRIRSCVETDEANVPRFSFETICADDAVNDGHVWLRYGLIKFDPYPRHFFKCAQPGCKARRETQRVASRPQAVRVDWKGLHNHDPIPTQFVHK